MGCAMLVILIHNDLTWNKTLSVILAIAANFMSLPMSLTYTPLPAPIILAGGIARYPPYDLSTRTLPSRVLCSVSLPT